MAHLANKCGCLDPKTVILNLPDDSGINTARIHQSEKNLLILQVRFIDHSAANYTPQCCAFRSSSDSMGSNGTCCISLNASSSWRTRSMLSSRKLAKKVATMWVACSLSL